MLTMLTLIAVLSQPPATATVDLSKPVLISAPELFDKLEILRKYLDFGLTPLFETKQERLFDGQVLAVDELVLHPGSRLIFGGAFGDRSDRYIAARIIRVLPGQPAPVITWTRDRSTPRLLSAEGKAQPGSIGGGDGADGTRGADGITGNPGYPGRSAPTIYVVTARIEGGPIVVDLRGQDGGPGGEGQPGGEGGIGRSGRPSVSTLVGCREPGGNGGRGGPGGNGGKGGPGGRGGNGGTFVLVTHQRTTTRFQSLFAVQLAGGMGGPAGRGGPAGMGGTGGGGGNAVGTCQGGTPGERGLDGQSGADGENGLAGSDGVMAVSGFTDQQLQTHLRGK